MIYLINVTVNDNLEELSIQVYDRNSPGKYIPLNPQ